MYETPKKLPVSQSKSKSSEDALLSTDVQETLIYEDTYHLSKSKLQSPLQIERSPISTSDEFMAEDRFIPSRRLIPEFDILSKEINDENEFSEDPQSLSVAQIYCEEILGKKNERFDMKSKNELETFKCKNVLKYKLCDRGNKEIGLCLENMKDLTRGRLNIRKINKNSKKILDAPALSDDFYLNVIDWSLSNQLAVGLGDSIFVWNANNSKVSRVCEVPDNIVTSVSWSQTDPFLSIGCQRGQVLIWDINKQKLIRNMSGHTMRVGTQSWGKNFLSTGSRDKRILQRDIRSSKYSVQELYCHTHEVCGLKWSKDDQYLASGGNDNRAFVWNLSGQAINKFIDHKAAVKAIAWSPHQYGLLATGGGSADRMIKLRNIFSGETVHEEDTGSQVCSLEFSKSVHELVSTHGFSENEINIWHYPQMRKIASLRGHTYRVLYLALSPDGTTIVTGSGDETLRFWEIFPSIENKRENESLLEMSVKLR